MRDTSKVIYIHLNKDKGATRRRQHPNWLTVVVWLGIRGARHNQLITSPRGSHKVLWRHLARGQYRGMIYYLTLHVVLPWQNSMYYTKCISDHLFKTLIFLKTCHYWPIGPRRSNNSSVQHTPWLSSAESNWAAWLILKGRELSLVVIFQRSSSDHHHHCIATIMIQKLKNIKVKYPKYYKNSNESCTYVLFCFGQTEPQVSNEFFAILLKYPTLEKHPFWG